MGTLLELNEIYNKDTKTSGLFTNYVNKFLKMKTESNWISWTLEKQTFINDYYDNEGILLDIENMKPNPWIKAISKLFLNSYFCKNSFKNSDFILRTKQKKNSPHE